jgi:predicted membrane protein
MSAVPGSAATPAPTRIQWPSLMVALLIMVGGTLYPPLMADAAGKADHNLAMALFWAMSAGFVRGVGFVPRAWIWRAAFSGWACLVTLLLAVVLKLQH